MRRFGIGVACLIAACGGSPRSDSAEPSDGAEAPSTDAQEGNENAQAGMGAPAPTQALAVADEETPITDMPGFDDTPDRTNVSFDSAMELEVDGLVWLQDIVVPAQVDYYSFQAQAGEFYEVRTDSDRFSPDVVISLYDAEQNLIAQNDDGEIWPGDAIDARLVFRVPTDGTYYVRVEDPWTTAGFFEGPFPLRFYHLGVRTLRPGLDGFAVATSGDPVEAVLQTDEASGYAYVTLVGSFGTDPETFELTATTDKALVAQVQASGDSGNGSTAFAGELRVLSEQDQVLARIDRAAGQTLMAPPVTDGRYRMELQGADTLGDNPFYAVDLVMVPDNPAELDDAGNDEPAGAEPIEMVDGTWRRGLILFSLPQGDVDYFQFDAAQGEFVDVRCEGASGGSGVHELSAELSDTSGAVLASGLEMTTENLRIDRMEIVEAGTHLLRLSSGTADGDTSVEPWVRCAVVVGP